MRSQLGRYLIAGIGAITVGILLIPILFFLVTITYIAAIPSRIGEQARIDSWLYRGMDKVLDINLMRQFRNDIYYRIRPHIELAEDYDRWWIMREMERSRERTNNALQSGEYAIALLLAFGSVFLDTSLSGIPVSAMLTFLAIALSGLVFIRITTIKILAFKPEVYRDEPTHDLAVRMGFNRGPFSQGSSILIALLTLLIGSTRGLGYELGLEIIEFFAAKTHPQDVERWHANK